MKLPGWEVPIASGKARDASRSSAGSQPRPRMRRGWFLIFQVPKSLISGLKIFIKVIEQGNCAFRMQGCETAPRNVGRRRDYCCAGCLWKTRIVSYHKSKGEGESNKHSQEVEQRDQAKTIEDIVDFPNSGERFFAHKDGPSNEVDKRTKQEFNTRTSETAPFETTAALHHGDINLGTR